MKKLWVCVILLSLLAVPAYAADCVEVDLEVDPVLVPGEVYYFYAELTNCSDESGLIYLTVSIDYLFGTFTFPEFPVYLGAGESFIRSVPFMLPPSVPTGDGSICVTAVKGEAEASDCVYFTIENDGGRGQERNIDSKETKPSSAMD